MPFNGSGVYTAPSLPGSFNPAQVGGNATPTDWNTLLQDIQTALSTTVTRDGQSTITANIPMNSHKLTGLANGSNLQDSVAVSQVQQGALEYATVGGTGDAVTLTLSPVPSALVVGQAIRFIVGTTNTTGVTLNVNSLGAGDLKWPDGSALTAGQLVAGSMVEVLVKSVSPLVFHLQTIPAPASGVPVGVWFPYGGAAAPAGYLLCAGQAVSRTTYATLFAVIGTSFGAGDGSTTFNIPDKRGRADVGLDNMGGTPAGRLTSTTMTPDGNTMGATGGTQTHTLTIAEMPEHDHDYTGPGSTPGSPGGGIVAPNAPGTKTSKTGGGGAHLNVQPSLAANAIIRFQ